MQMPSFMGDDVNLTPYEKYQQKFLSMGASKAYSEALRLTGLTIGIFQDYIIEGEANFNQGMKEHADSLAAELSDMIKALQASYPQELTNLQIKQLQSLIDKAYSFYDEIKEYPVKSGFDLPQSVLRELNISNGNGNGNGNGIPTLAKVALIAGAAWLAYKNFA